MPSVLSSRWREDSSAFRCIGKLPGEVSGVCAADWSNVDAVVAGSTLSGIMVCSAVALNNGHGASVVSSRQRSIICLECAEREEVFVTGGHDGSLNVFDAAALDHTEGVDGAGLPRAVPKATLNEHVGMVRDLSLSSAHPSLVASASADRSFRLWDWRAESNSAHVVHQPSGMALRCISFLAASEHFIGVGGQHSPGEAPLVHIWDIRKLCAPVHAGQCAPCV